MSKKNSNRNHHNLNRQKERALIMAMRKAQIKQANRRSKEVK
jgi:hypothetical protein